MISPRIKKIASYIGATKAITPGTQHESHPPKETKPCVLCGRPKQHNNAFCSADCAKLHKQIKQKLS
jgi:hypothetical protein